MPSSAHCTLSRVNSEVIDPEAVLETVILWWLSSEDEVRFWPWNCHQSVTSEASGLCTLHWNWALFPSKAVSSFLRSAALVPSANKRRRNFQWWWRNLFSSSFFAIFSTMLQLFALYGKSPFLKNCLISQTREADNVSYQVLRGGGGTCWNPYLGAKG